MKRPAPEFHAIRAEIPCGSADYWAIIRELDAVGTWTIAMIVGRTRSHHEVVGRYVRRLAKGGFAEKVGVAATSGCSPSSLYRLVKFPADAPRLREDGSELPPTSQELMWRAMRTLIQFDATELAFAASTDEVSVHLKAARSYIARLNAAGYLAVARAAAHRRLAVYRLKHAMNTGPRHPMVMLTRIVWDPNRAAVMGDASPAEEAS